ncbi:MAG: hypothetical protein DRQ03_08310 [Candidatus Hydrothermota bacterium]|nr:MAG: hypothetical protein DRQ03_08310 [Candidatus Hydrothermae bacterium]
MIPLQEGETSVNLGGKFKVLDKKMFCSERRGFMKAQLKSKIFDFLVNLKPYFYERYFAWIFPAREIHYLLKVIK